MARALIAIVGMLVGASCCAQNLGVHGQSYPIAEPDMLTMIEAKAKQFVESGRYEIWKQESIERAAQSFRSPPPADVKLAVKRRERLFDPSAFVPEDIKDTDGRVLVPAGTSFNPLDYQPPIKPLVFFDAREPAQVAWAERLLAAEGGKPVLTAGQWLDLSKRWGRQVYFDVGGWITRRFGIEAVPAVVRQTGKMLSITEEPVVAGAELP